MKNRPILPCDHRFVRINAEKAKWQEGMNHATCSFATVLSSELEEAGYL